MLMKQGQENAVSSPGFGLTDTLKRRGRTIVSPSHSTTGLSTPSRVRGGEPAENNFLEF